MLVENNFFFLSLPRCGSTSFMASCVKYNLEIRHANENLDIENQLKKRNKKLSKINYQDFSHEFAHSHESLDSLIRKFGNHYEIISVRRNKYERFISLWKHILHEMNLLENKSVYKLCSKLSVDDILFFESNDLINEKNLLNTVDSFVEKNKLYDISDYGRNMLAILLRPYSTYHNNYEKIIWFDFENLNQLEEWVSKKLNIEFKLMSLNSSQHFQCNLQLDENFKYKYDKIYFIYDEVKNKKTLI